MWNKKLIEWSCTAAVTTGRFPVGIRMFYCKYLGIVLVGWLMTGTVSNDCIWSCARIFFNLPWRTSLSHRTRHVCMMSHASSREGTYGFGKLAGTFCVYTGCPRRNVRDLGRVFLMLNYTDITQNTYVQIWTVTDIVAREKCGLHWCRRTVRRPWRHTCPMRLPDKETW